MVGRSHIIVSAVSFFLAWSLYPLLITHSPAVLLDPNVIPLYASTADKTVISTNSVALHAPNEFPSLDCLDLLKQMRAGTYSHQVTDPNRGQIHVGRTKTAPKPFYWSVHDKEFDIIRWLSFEEGYYYETALTDCWIKVLQNADSETQVVLDVGGNIGFFALLTANMGHVVHTFEPNYVNILRQCESSVYNLWHMDRIHNIHALGISDTTGELPFFVNKNPGASSFEAPSPGVRPTFSVPVTTLDYFTQELGLRSKSSISILKIDVEGHEAAAIMGAQELLRGQAVDNVFLELRLLAPNGREALHVLQDAGYQLYMYGGNLGPDKVNPSYLKSNTELVDKMYKNPERYITRDEPYVNMWWKLPSVPAL